MKKLLMLTLALITTIFIITIFYVVASSDVSGDIIKKSAQYEQKNLERILK